MAKKNRVDLNAVIQANLPDNTVDFITPALDREVEIDEVDSCFNLEDDTAVDVNYSPTTPADWDVTPTEVGGGLDELAGRVKTLEGSISSNPSDNIAYVSDSGSDVVGEFEIGNPLKPFLTIQAACNAVGNNSIVKVLGGTYTEPAPAVAYLINLVGKNNFYLDLSSVIINGSILMQNCTDCFCNLSSAKINSTLSYALNCSGSLNCSINLEGGSINGGRIDLRIGGAADIKLTGGKIIQSTSSPALVVGDNSIVDSVYIQGDTVGNTAAALVGNGANPLKKAIISNCEIVDSINYAVTGSNMILDNCYILGLAGFKSNSIGLCELKNCRIESTFTSTYSLGGEGTLQGKFNNCTFVSAFNNVRFFGTSQDLNFENCTFIAAKDCLEVSSTITRSGDDTIIQNCSFFPAQTNALGVVLNDALGYGTDTGVSRFIRSTYSKAWSTTDAARAIDYNSTTIVGLLPPPIV